MHTEARGHQDSRQLGDELSPILGRELRQTGSSCQSNEERGGQRWQKTQVAKLSGWLSQEFLMPHASWFGRRGQTRSTSCSGGGLRVLLRPFARWIFALEENFSAACMRRMGRSAAGMRLNTTRLF